jgi:hypothetical protein
MTLSVALERPTTAQRHPMSMLGECDISGDVGVVLFVLA